LHDAISSPYQPEVAEGKKHDRLLNPLFLWRAIFMRVCAVSIDEFHLHNAFMGWLREINITLENFKGGDERHEGRTVEI